MKVFLIHGIFDDGRLFKKMDKYLKNLGIITIIPSLKPADARHGINDLANKLKIIIDQHTDKNEKFTIVGFSLGCLISRAYLQDLGGANRCINFHAISGPHSGSTLAYFFVGQGAKDLRPNSLFLRMLDKTQHRLKHINLFSYRTPFDLMIVPSKSSHWPIAKNYITQTPMHRMMLNNRLVLESIKNSLTSELSCVCNS